MSIKETLQLEQTEQGEQAAANEKNYFDTTYANLGHQALRGQLKTIYDRMNSAVAQDMTRQEVGHDRTSPQAVGNARNADQFRREHERRKKEPFMRQAEDIEAILENRLEVAYIPSSTEIPVTHLGIPDDEHLDV